MKSQFHVALNHYCRVQFHLKWGGKNPTVLKTSSDFSARIQEHEGSPSNLSHRQTACPGVGKWLSSPMIS